MGRHRTPTADTFDATVDEYVTQRARELIRQFDRSMAGGEPGVYWPDWCGQAVEILRELTRDA